MIRQFFLLTLVGLQIVLSGCISSGRTGSLIVEDAGNYTNEGVRAYEEADWSRAQALFLKAVTLYQRIDDQKGILKSYINLSEVALAARDYQSAQQYLSIAHKMTQEPELSQFQNRVGLLYSQLYMQKKHYIQAKMQLQKILPDFEADEIQSIPDSIQLAAIANRTKLAFLLEQDEALWVERFTRTLTDDRYSSSSLEARLLRFQAAILILNQTYSTAVEKLQLALKKYKASSLQTGIAATLSELGQLAFKQGDWQQAKQYLLRANRIYEYTGNQDKFRKNQQTLTEIQAIQAGKNNR